MKTSTLLLNSLNPPSNRTELAFHPYGNGSVFGNVFVYCTYHIVSWRFIVLLWGEIGSTSACKHTTFRYFTSIIQFVYGIFNMD